MVKIGMFEAKTRFSEIIERVRLGEFIKITKNGKPIACIIPDPDARTEEVAKTIQAIEKFSQGNKLKGLKIKDMIQDGRR